MTVEELLQKLMDLAREGKGQVTVCLYNDFNKSSTNILKDVKHQEYTDGSEHIILYNYR